MCNIILLTFYTHFNVLFFDHILFPHSRGLITHYKSQNFVTMDIKRIMPLRLVGLCLPQMQLEIYTNALHHFNPAIPFSPTSYCVAAPQCCNWSFPKKQIDSEHDQMNLLVGVFTVEQSAVTPTPKIRLPAGQSFLHLISVVDPTPSSSVPSLP